MTHEEKHADQWAMGGMLFGLHYLGVELAAKAVKWATRYQGDAECLNPYEIWAGLKAGGYSC
jgi:hypothetical protein